MNGRMPKSMALRALADLKPLTDLAKLDVHPLVPVANCPTCGVRAIVPLTPRERLAQPDDTTHVCHPSLGGCNQGFTDARTREAPSTRDLIARLGAAVKKYDELAARPVREWVPSGGTCPPDCDEPCEFHGGEKACRSGKLVDVPVAQADGDDPSATAEVETASEHVRNALQILRTTAHGVEYVPGYLQMHESDVAAIERRLTAALALVENVDAARVEVSGRQRTVERMLGQVVEALGLDNTDWHISDVLKTIAALQAPARGRRS